MNKYVVSTKGATYNIEELKIETIADFREKKLKQIGL
jgi:hypothetical protein